MELDHIFLVVFDRNEAIQMFEDAGLVASYSRHHTSQGTSNLCACLDDMYIELLWFDGSPISSATSQISLALRKPHQDNCHIGISWRGDAIADTVDYVAPWAEQRRVLGFAHFLDRIGQFKTSRANAPLRLFLKQPR